MVLFCVFFLRKVVFFCKVFFLTALFLYFASGFDCFARCFVLFCSVLFCSRKKCLFCFFSCAYDFFFLHEVLLQVFFAKGLVLFLARFFCFAMGFVLFSCFAIFLQRLIFCFSASFFFFAKCCFRKCFRYFLQVFVFGKVMYSLRLFFFARFFFSFFLLQGVVFFQWILCCFLEVFFLARGFVFLEWVLCLWSVCVFFCMVFFCLFFALDSVIFFAGGSVFFFWPRVLRFFLLLVWCYFFCFFFKVFFHRFPCLSKIFFFKKKSFLLKLFVHEVGFSPKRLFFISSEIDVLFCFFKKKGLFFRKSLVFCSKVFFSKDFLLQGLFSSVFFFQTFFQVFLFSIFFQCFLASFFSKSFCFKAFSRNESFFFQGFFNKKRILQKKNYTSKRERLPKKKVFLTIYFCKFFVY